MKFPFLFKPTENSTSTATSSSSSSSTATAAWPWPTCVNNPKTLSFREINFHKNEEIFLEQEEPSNTEAPIKEIESPEDDDVVLCDLKSDRDRLFFKPGETNSILEEAKPTTATTITNFPNKETTITAMDSTDPFVDFRVSMEEMVQAYGLKDWESLEDLLTCYLKVNSKSNHGYIVGAFVDLLIRLVLQSSSNVNGCSCDDSSAIDGDLWCSSTATQCSFTSPLSFSSTTDSSLENEEHEINVVVESSSSSCNDAPSSGV